MTGGARRTRSPGAKRHRHAVAREFPPLVVGAHVIQRFNAYATAAFPNEVGGLLRIVRDRNGMWRVVDLRVLRQHSRATRFDIDPAAIALHNFELVRAGRAEEAEQWRGDHSRGGGLAGTGLRSAAELRAIDRKTRRLVVCGPPAGGGEAART